MHGCRVSTQDHYLHGSRSRGDSALYIAAGSHIIVIYTAAVQEPNRLYILLSGVYIVLLFARQPFKSQFKIIADCARVPHTMLIYRAVIETVALMALNAIKQIEMKTKFFIG